MKIKPAAGKKPATIELEARDREEIRKIPVDRFLGKVERRPPAHPTSKNQAKKQ